MTDKYFDPGSHKYIDLLSDYHGMIQINGSFIDGCYEQANTIGSEFFGLNEGGGCWTSRMYRMYEDRFQFHPASNCVSGIGGKNTIFVYHNRKLNFNAMFRYHYL